jgi:hypothetical protein
MKKNSNCNKCLKKKLFLNICKCDNYFCLDCLPYFNHNCKFDWKKNNRDLLFKNNPVIKPIKVNNI